ncbi:cell envelope integrity protein CreD [Hymenobacter jeollabukensis]|uniref:Cell envelope integrity protein CreD n=1 Tax=Hymenobacter jeollabukensis TaxID=2025313 RepID=A0A5R8WIW2_9BACT|nr:cell envelope integrity protein CreD [Hymenobacter jeollabukensis]TLM88690.1 cell envelope integrity protein CreD [Hymenobacter jeollabukensis]
MTPEPQELTVGDAVLTVRERNIGVVYAVDPAGSGRFSVSVLLSDGTDAGSYSPGQADELLQRLGPTGVTYSFHSAMRLRRDWQSGYFKQAFATARLLAGFVDPDLLGT